MHDTPESKALADWLALQRPALHRYCARMTGSVADGEDVVQDTLLKAVQSFPGFGVLADPKAWLFRVAHNAAMDLLRSRARAPEAASDEVLEALAAPEEASSEARWIAQSALRCFMWLTPAERSSVILMDVLGYTLQEITEITGRTVLAVKASLHRGRGRLREIVAAGEALEAPPLAPAEQQLLEQYVMRFNARDFDGVRAMLGEEVQLDLVGRKKMCGRQEVGTYLHNYERIFDWHFTPAVVEGRPAMVAHDPLQPHGEPLYLVLLAFEHGQVRRIRDFRYARYATEVLALGAAPSAGAGPALPPHPTRQ
jgi:RNA polymerase sigma-70 factor (ECF subfamily)